MFDLVVNAVLLLVIFYFIVKLNRGVGFG